jgi:NodT family efflux transporter outer membrane factor (OMF) lipoprotein
MLRHVKTMDTRARAKNRSAAGWARTGRGGALLVLLTGCAVGPKYVKPALPETAAWSATAQGATAMACDEKALATWWSTFDDPVLTSLVERASSHNLDLLRARARVREARARRGGAAADLLPSVSASASASRKRASTEAGSGGTADLFQAGLDASWELDLFGGTRRAVEAATASLQASVEDERDVAVSLAAEVALTYVELRATETRLALARRSLAALQESAELTRWRAEAGLTTQLDAEQARSLLEQARAALPPLERTIARDRSALAVLVGLQPGGLDEELKEARPVPPVSRSVAVGVPADTLRRRPDVRRAERNLAAQTAQVGVAVADRYPRLTLTGSIGLESLTVAGLTGGGAGTSSIAAGLLGPIFDAGKRKQAVEVQEALLEQSHLAYRQTVLSSLKEVEDALVAFDREQARRAALSAAADAAREATGLARDQYLAGLVAYTAVIDAERTLLGVQDALAASEGDVGADLVRLYKALGGGWPFAAAVAQETP